MATAGFDTSQRDLSGLSRLESIYWHSDDPAICSPSSLDTNNAKQHAKSPHERPNSKEELNPSYIFDFCFSIWAHGFPIEVAIRTGHSIRITLPKVVEQ